MYPGHYPSKTGTVCFQPIAWPMEGVVLDFISACNRLGFQTDREHPLLVNTQHFFNNQFLQEIKKTATQHPTQRAEKTCGAHHKKKSCHQDGQAGATSADTGVFLATQMMMSRCDLKKIFSPAPSDHDVVTVWDSKRAGNTRYWLIPNTFSTISLCKK